MPKVPAENYDRIISALKPPGVSRGSPTRQPCPPGKTAARQNDQDYRAPRHRPVKRSTLSRILKQAEIALEIFLAAL